MTKQFMQSLDPRIFQLLQKEGKKRGIKVQELIRGTIVPEWLKEEKENGNSRPVSRNRKVSKTA